MLRGKKKTEEIVVLQLRARVFVCLVLSLSHGADPEYPLAAWEIRASASFTG